MSDCNFNQRITKSRFEQRLAADLEGKLTCRQHTENGYQATDTKVAKMTLYYLDGVHCGTWQSGLGWIFQHAYTVAQS